MKEHVNFYENLKEAHIRLRGTIVMYDGEPYFVQTIAAHKPDGVFRVYLSPMDSDIESLPPIHQIPFDHSTLGTALDNWMQENPKTKVIRKMMNSPLFNKFRPFPLGMCFWQDDVIFLERSPLRVTQQGLAGNHIVETLIDLSNDTPGEPGGYRRVPFAGKEMRDCILGIYPSAQDCVRQLNNPDVSNNSAAFHRNFAVTKGPVGTMFVAYKTDVVGILPDANLSVLRLGREYAHVYEAAQELGVFGRIEIQ